VPLREGGQLANVTMPCTLGEARTKVRQADAKKGYHKMIAAGVKQNNRTAATVRRNLEKGGRATNKFKQEAARANSQAMRHRISKRHPDNTDVKARALNSRLNELRRGV
jgi:hypothetical protein